MIFSIFDLFDSVVRLKFVPLISATLISTLAIVVSPQYLAAQNFTDNSSITIRSDSQEANSETGVITAQGNVQINYPSRQIQATAAQAQYYSRERRLVLNGNVYVIQEGNSMRAESMTYLIDEGRFIATPRSDRQVESTYIVTEPISEQSPVNSEQ
ncbi:MAG: LptA/OstA family protein [Xenococcus sp. (in: cyanobacteria)]